MLNTRQAAFVLVIVAALLALAGSHGPDIVAEVASSDVIRHLATVLP